MKLQINELTRIYVVCPANNKTGGTELLHQLVFQLNELTGGHDKAVLAYYLEGKCNRNDPTPDEFKQYIQHKCFVNEIVDNSANVLILPEICVGKHKKFKYIQKMIWWLSVDNYYVMSGKWNRLKRWGILSFLKHLVLNDYASEKDLYKIPHHMVQSYFAKDFFMRKGISENRIIYLSDYINDIYISGEQMDEKLDIVIYNPQKGYEYTKILMETAPDIQWIPIQNMTNEEVFHLMHKAKVYIDFGNHPGKDRIPREAAVSGCCIITNKNGSAAFWQDVPIPEKYKYGDDSTPEKIIEAIRKCINNYDEEIVEFHKYCDFIKSEKTKFIEDIKNIFAV